MGKRIRALTTDSAAGTPVLWSRATSHAMVTPAQSEVITHTPMPLRRMERLVIPMRYSEKP